MPLTRRFSMAAAEVTTPRLRVTARSARSGGGGDSRRPTTRSLAADYLELCQHPLRNLSRWLEEGRRSRGVAARKDQPSRRKAEGHERAHQQTFRVHARELCREPLPQLRSGLDANRQGWRRPDCMSARPGTGLAGYVGLRSLRAEGKDLMRPGRSPLATEPLASLGSARAALLALYGAKIEATRRSVPRRDLSAALCALFEQQRAALQELAQRRHILKSARRDRRRAAHAGRREQNRRARPL